MNKQEIEVFNTAKEYIERLIVGINETVEFIQSGNDKKGIEMIPLIGEGIEYIINVISLLKIELNGEETIENLNTQLEEIIDGIENGDYVLIADIFKYEIVPIMEQLKIIFEQIS
ncbi:hypothetical protein H7E67_19345 [Clostridium gasigenes]|uniref:DUF8042 domain-containing protein n=1 Tax=Clostridium gasigenes TaxID=94869 RepID=A0A7X0V8G2_9CLOT|nr:hypothetical protein [Clostridium gasigenes]MBB6625559.1 hypothetical protein [Clostridium gasigenes]MBB6714596.1 hypothetical protein [Clostridium gasigenes]MBU3090444.1 hypothetical protein [Clostridium gasigenes]